MAQPPVQCVAPIRDTATRARQDGKAMTYFFQQTGVHQSLPTIDFAIVMDVVESRKVRDAFFVDYTNTIGKTMRDFARSTATDVYAWGATRETVHRGEKTLRIKAVRVVLVLPVAKQASSHAYQILPEVVYQLLGVDPLDDAFNVQTHTAICHQLAADRSTAAYVGSRAPRLI